MAPGQSSNTTQTTKIELPPWVDKAARDNYKFAQDIANDPNKFYTGPRVAGMDPASTMAYKRYNSDGRAATQYGAAGAGYGALSGFQADNVMAGQLADADLSKYMNPYIDNVVNRSMDNLERQRSLAIMANADKAASAGAFGGSKAGIVDAVTNSETARQAGDLSAGLYGQAFTQAQQGAMGDIMARLQADQGNQAAGINAAGVRMGAAQGQQSLGDALQAMRNQNYQTGSQYGMQSQMTRQRQLDAKKALFDERQGAKLEDLNILLSALGMSPYGKTETANKESSGSSGVDFGSIGAGFLGLLPFLAGLSDADEKTDIKKVGRDPGTGLDLYAYRYKGDPKTYPKVVGPMAQDIEKKYPQLVRKVAGKRVVLGMGR